MSEQPFYTDADVEAMAEAMHDREYPEWIETAHPDHNRWSWRGDAHTDEHKEQYRNEARALLDAAAPIVARAQAQALREMADQLDSDVEDMDENHPFQLSYINCTRIDAQSLRRRADAIEAAAS